MSDTDPNVKRQCVCDLVLGYCGEGYGENNCTAAIGTTGADYCYRTRGTCQDVVNFDKTASGATTKTYRLALANGPRMPGIQAWYVLDGVTVAPARLDDKRGLGGISDVSIQASGFYDDDAAQDPYRSLRSKVFEAPFFARLIQRNPHYRGDSVVLREGTLEADGSADVDNWDTRTYVLDSFKESPDGKVKITAKDGLTSLLTTVMPAPVSVELAASMTNVQTTATVKSGQGDTLGTPTYWIKVDDEIMKVTARTGDGLTTIVRAQAGSSAETHDADAKVTKGRVWEAASLDTVWADMLTDSGLVAAQIDTTGAATEVAYVAGGLSFTAYLFDELKAAEWMRILMRSGNAFTWWDPVAAKVKLKTVRPRALGETATTITEGTHIAMGSVGVELLEDGAYTRGSIYLAPKDWSQDLEDADNYSRRVVYIDAVEEAAYGAIREKPPTFAPFAPASQFTEMESRIYREISRFIRPARRVVLDLALRDASGLDLGDDVDLTTSKMVDDTGAAVLKECRVTKIAYPRDGGIRYGYEMETTQAEGKWGQWTDDTGTQLTRWSDDDGFLADGYTPGWRWV